MEIVKTENGIMLKSPENFDLAMTLDCGQAFRWRQNEDGGWCGVVNGCAVTLCQNDSGIEFFGVSEDDFKSFWVRYFDLERDYSKVIDSVKSDKVLYEASKMCGGIRILRQEPFETLCSFIISQNNNIPRIKGIIERLCQSFGEQKNGCFAFPTAQVLASCTVEDLAPLRSGFRARYIIDAAQKCADGTVDFNKIENLPLDEARNELMQICGVGAKVADCTLLFGLGRIDAFPKDVWIKRALSELFDGELPECAVPYAGIAQQYIFHYIRTKEQ